MPRIFCVVVAIFDAFLAFVVVAAAAAVATNTTVAIYYTIVYVIIVFVAAANSFLLHFFPVKNIVDVNGNFFKIVFVIVPPVDFF